MSRQPTRCCVAGNKLPANYGLTALFLCTSWKNTVAVFWIAGNDLFVAVYLVCCPTETMHDKNYMVISKVISAVQLEYNLYKTNTLLNSSRPCWSDIGVYLNVQKGKTIWKRLSHNCEVAPALHSIHTLHFCFVQQLRLVLLLQTQDRPTSIPGQGTG